MGGELRFDTQSRALYATDASNFRHVPIGVVVPRDPSDVVAAVRVCSEHDVPIVSRGGGTGLAGQSLNAAVVIDHSKYLRGVLGIDPQARTARVLPGTVLDDLRARAGECGLTFGPDPSTHDRCTLGGMIGNNSCGVHSVQAEFYGPGPRTEDNVESLDVLTYDGVRLRVGPTSDEACAEIQRQGGRAAAIYRELRGIVERHGDAIRSGFPSIPRRVSGYNLPALLPESGFDVAKALVGSEGTCVTVLEATVKLCRRFPERALLLLGYPTVFAAGDDVPRIREHRPIGTEGIDSALVDYIRRKGMHPGYADILPEGQGVAPRRIRRRHEGGSGEPCARGAAESRRHGGRAAQRRARRRGAATSPLGGARVRARRDRVRPRSGRHLARLGGRGRARGSPRRVPA